jgi:hypothetical protein
VLVTSGGDRRLWGNVELKNYMGKEEMTEGLFMIVKEVPSYFFSAFLIISWSKKRTNGSGFALGEIN